MGRLRLFTTALSATVVGFLARYIARFEAVDASMEPTIRTGDFLVATRLTGSGSRSVPPSTLVVFPHPTDGDMLLVKRVVAVAGDTVAIRGGRLSVNQTALAQPWAQGALAGKGDWKLGKGQMFVLSDNRTVDTADSRTFGPIDVRKGVWRVRFRYWPISRIGAITD